MKGGNPDTMKYKKHYKRNYAGKFISDAQHKRNAIRKRNQFLWGLTLTALTGAIAFSLPQPLPYVNAEDDPQISVEVIELKSDVDRIIYDVAPQFNQDPALISKITWCESEHKDVVHDKGYGKGVSGIQRATFDLWNTRFEKEYGFKLNYTSTHDQIRMTSWAFSKGEEYRNQWTTYVAYMKGGKYTFYSSQLKGTFTARCS